jgi:hypothetical protein
MAPLASSVWPSRVAYQPTRCSFRFRPWQTKKYTLKGCRTRERKSAREDPLRLWDQVNRVDLRNLKIPVVEQRSPGLDPTKLRSNPNTQRLVFDKLSSW